MKATTLPSQAADAEFGRRDTSYKLSRPYLAVRQQSATTPRNLLCPLLTPNEAWTRVLERHLVHSDLHLPKSARGAERGNMN
jgi:hypothetical protein